MLRRDALATPFLLGLLPALGAVRTAAAQAEAGTPFDASTVRNAARELAGKPFRAPDTALPAPLSQLSYDQYRMLRFDPQRAWWRNDNLPFQMQFFHRGFLYGARVDLLEVSDGRARPILYSPDLFSFGEVGRPPAGDLGFAGFRLHAPINRSDYFDEVCSFLGASYFRAVGKDQGYGLSARGLAIKTADPAGEEFPVFRSFWIERPRPGVNSVVVHALLDSPSAAASFRFTIRPGEDTVFDVETTVFPRVDIAAAGIAPLTSMFFFAPNDRAGVDDYRSAVHDSDGLLMATGRGEQLWRPLNNPRDLQVSIFADSNPRGFGLMQRRRDFASYKDLEARYERRPSLWVEPIGDWGEGGIQLIEIPTTGEIHDNIVAFWRPKEPLRAKGEYGFVYRLHWLPTAPGNTELGKIVDTRSGAGGQNARLFVLDAAGGKLAALPTDATPTLEISANAGRIQNAVVGRNPDAQGWRIAFELLPGGAGLVELRALLKAGEQPLTESWVYRWTP
ncbi:glucan biosynthesis protein [Roseomonas sp. BN140053]|uniref:glucan biosynthesis protein n=1 Tax=Roseomonas sp. BN140053 TaxID=3391898 RepID=UPI0039ED3B28